LGRSSEKNVKHDQYYVIVVGGVVTEETAGEIESEGYGRVVTDAVIVCDLLPDCSIKRGTGTIRVFQGSIKRHGAKKPFYDELE
jgi:hypothetical protein